MNSAVKTFLLLAFTAAVLRADDRPFAVQEQDAHSKIWVQTNELGQVTSSFVSLATGLSRWDASLGKWADADASLEIVQGPEGGAAARNGQHRLTLSADANSQNATVDVEMPDGSHIQLQTVGIALTTKDNSRSMFIGEVKQSIGTQIDANTVVYTDAFTPIKGDLRIRNTLAGVESDVIIREKIDPTEWNFQPEDCRLEVWTQVLQSPLAHVKTETIPGRLAGNADRDEQIAYSGMAFSKGTAFRVDAARPGSSDQLAAIRVAKELADFPAENMTFLIEAVPFLEAKPEIDTLPVDQARLKTAKDMLERAMVRNTSGRRAKPHSLLAQSLPKGPKNQAMASLLKSNPLARPGFVMDYSLVSSSTNFTFKGDVTYYVNSDVFLSGTTTIEGGAVIKFTNSVPPTINVTGPVVCNTGPYRPAVFTAKDDDSVGHVIPGSSGSPSGSYAANALKLNSGSAVALHHIRSSYAANGIQFWSGGGELKHAQFVNCGVGVSSYSSATVYLRNVLVYNSTTALYGNGSTIKGEHLTINKATSGFVNGASTTLTLTNSLMYAVTTPGTYSGVANVINPGTSPFLAIGSSSNYLATYNPSLHDAGSTNIEANLARELRSMTTDAPLLMTNNITSDTVLWPRAQRDTDLPNIGYHFDPIDYAFKGIMITNATLTFTNGVAACFAGEEGIYLRAGAKVVSVGLPNQLNRFTRAESVQELPLLWGATGYMLAMFRQYENVTPAPEARFRFTDFTVLANVPAHRVIIRTDLYPINLIEFRDSWIRGAAQSTGIYTNTLVTVTMTNNLVEYGDLRFEQGWETTNNYPLTLSLRNNTFYGSYMQLYFHTNTWAWSAYDNLFDQVTSFGSGNKTFDNKNNAFLSSYAFPGQTNSLAITNAFYQAGPLGRYYFATTSPLVDAGSLTNAALIGLYHYTTLTNQTKEMTNRLDIGFHYVAVDSLGNPLDGDGDGLADYSEDRNGNGAKDTGETDFQNPDSDGDGVSDSQEKLDRTDPNDCYNVLPQLLASWHFNDPTNYVYGDQGQIPTQRTNISLLNSTSCWDVAAIKIAPSGSTDAKLGYAEMRQNGSLNMARKYGTIVLWYMPSWAPLRGGTSEGTIFSLEGTNNSISDDFFGIQIGNAGTNITVRLSPSTTVISLTNSWPTLNQWHQIVLSYTPSTVWLYTDGALGASNSTTAFANWAPPQKGGSTVWIGGRLGRFALGSFDAVSTYSYPFDAEAVSDDFQTVQQLDADHDGLPDLQEIAMGLNPLNPDTDGDHMPDKWEVRYGLNPKVNDANGDPDSDTMTNLSEYLAGRNPRKANSVRDSRFIWKTAAAASELINMSFGASEVTGPAYVGFSDSLADVWTPVLQSTPVTQLMDSSGTYTPVTLDLSFGTVYSVYKLDGCAPSTISGSGSVNGTSGVDIDPVWVNYDCTFIDIGGYWGGMGCTAATGADAGSYTTYEDGSPYFGGYTYGAYGYGSSGYGYGGYGYGDFRRYEYARYYNNGYGYRTYYGVPWFIENCFSYFDRHCCWLGVRRVHRGFSRLLRPGVHIPGAPAKFEEPYRPDRQAHDFPGFDILVDNTTSGKTNRFPVFDSGLKSAIAENLHDLPTDGTCGWMWDSSEANGKMVFRGLEPGRLYRLLVYANVQEVSLAAWAYSENTQARAQARAIAGELNSPPDSKLPTNFFGFEGVEAGAAPPSDKPHNGCISTLFRSLDGTYTVNVPWGGVVYGMQLQTFNPIASAPGLSDTTDYAYGVDGINLAWTGVDGAEAYDVYRKEGSSAWTLLDSRPAYVTYFIDSLADTTISHTYKVVARNGVSSRESGTVSTSTFSSPTLDRRPVLNAIYPLKQAFENTEFKFGSSAIAWSADAFDPEGAPLQFIIQSVIAGTLTLTNPGQAPLSLNEAYFANLQTNTYWNYPAIQIGGTLTWLPPTNSTGNIEAFKVIASDGGLVSAYSAVVSINVREPSALLWWGDYTDGGSGSGVGFTTWHEIASPWRKWELGSGYQEDPGFVLYTTNVPVSGKFVYSSATPVEAPFTSLRRIVNCQAVAAGWSSRAALSADGSVWTWGVGSKGELGDGREFYPSDVPNGPTWFTPYSTVAIKVQGIDSVQSVAAGQGFVLAAKADGSVWGWGDGSGGQLGSVPNTTHVSWPYDLEYMKYMGVGFDTWSGGTSVPRPISGLEGISQVAAGDLGGLALSGSGQVYCWGPSWAPAGSDHPRRAGVPGRVVQISAGGSHALALSDTGKVYAWGNNEVFQLGFVTASTDGTMVPGEVTGLSNVVYIATGDGHNLAVLADGTVREWGAVADGYGNDPQASIHLRTVPNLTNIVKVCASYYLAYAIDSAGNLFQWGYDPDIAYDPLYVPFDYGMPSLMDTLDEVESAITGPGNFSFALAKANLLTPHGLSIQPGDSQVTVRWKPFPNASSYFVKRSTSADGPFTFLANVSPVRSTSQVVYRDTTSLNGTRYYYTVAADVAGDLTADSKAVFATPRPVPLQLTVVAQARSRMVELTWRRVDDDTEYRVYRSDATAPTFQLVGNKALSYPDSNGIIHDLDPNLVAGRAYTYRVTAQNKSGVGPASANVVATPSNGTDPAPPSAITLLNQGDTAILVQWNRMTADHGQVHAIIKVAEWTGSLAAATNKLMVVGAHDQKFYAVGETEPTTDFFVVDGLTKGRQYMFDVCFVDDRGEGPGWYSVSGHTEILGHTGMADETLVDVTWDQQVAGNQTIYASWHNTDVFNYLVQLWKGPTNGVNTTNLVISSLVYPDQNGSAEFWMTGLTNTTNYHLRIDQFALTFSQGFDHQQFSTNLTPSTGFTPPSLPSFTGVPANQKVTLNWGGSNPDATLATFANWRFVLERLEQNFTNEGWIPVADGTNGYRYADTNLANGSGYRYKLTGIDPSFHVVDWPQLPSSTTYYVPGATFTSANESGWLATIQATSLQRAVLLSWGTLTNQTGGFAHHYEVRLVTDPFASDYVVLASPLQTASHSFTHRFLHNGERYYYVIAGVDANGDSCQSTLLAVEPSEASSLAVPAGYGASMADGRIFVSWEQVPGATAYQVDKPSGGTNWSSVGLFAQPGFSLAVPASTNWAYHYRVTPSGPVPGVGQEITVQAICWNIVTNAPSYVVFPCNVTTNLSACLSLTNTLLTSFAEVRVEAPVQTNQYWVYAQTLSDTTNFSTALANGPVVTTNVPSSLPPVNVSQLNASGLVVSIADFSRSSGTPTLFTTPTNLTVTAALSGGDNENAPVTRVDFYANGVLIGSKTEIPYNISWINPPGTSSGKLYQIVARAFDKAGRVQDSDGASYVKISMVPVLSAFRTAASDLSLAAPGIPLSFDRSYNSQDGEIGLLGKGWKTPWDRAAMAVPDLSSGWRATHIKLQTQIYDFQETSFHRIELTLPDGSKQFFGVNLDGSQALQQYVSDNEDLENPFAYSLGVNFYPLDFSSGVLRESDWSGTSWTLPNPLFKDLASMPETQAAALWGQPEIDFPLQRGSWPYAPKSLTYTDDDQISYIYALPDGATTGVFKLYSTSDRLGNWQQFVSTASGGLTAITNSNGRSIQLARPSTGTHAGYLCLYDPVSLVGTTIAAATPVVRYLVTNNVLTEVHRLRSRSAGTYDVSKYEYTSGVLTKVINPEGVAVLENVYLTNGFLDYQLDATGLKTQIAYTTSATNNVEELTTSVTQSLGGTNLMTQSAVFDASGQVIQASNGANEASGAGYDAKGQKRFEKDASGNFKTFDYDAQGRVIEATDQLGHSIGVDYDNFGRVRSSQDANGGTSTYQYSGTLGYVPNVGHPEGTLTSMTDASGMSTEYTYNTLGQVLTEIRRGQGMNLALTNRYGYTTNGSDLQWTETVLGVTGGVEVLARTDYTYDENGNRLTESRKRSTVKRNGSGVVQSGVSVQFINSTNTYDGQGRVVGTATGSVTDSIADAEVQTNGVTFTAAGRQAQSVDYLGRTNTVTTDVRGNTVQSLYADGTVTRTAYDILGRAQWTQDRTSVSGSDSTGPGTETEYDAAGRVKRVKRWENVVLRLQADTSYRGYNVTNTAQSMVVLVSRGIGGSPQPVSVTRTDYDGAGRVLYSIDARGGITRYVYDAAGRRSVVRSYLTETVSPAGTNQPTGTNYLSTGFAYDANGNQIAITNALGLVTESEYDVAGRKWRVVFPLVTGDTARKEQRTAYDGLGRRIMEMDEAGVITAFGYDLGGRLLTVTNDFQYGTNVSGMVTGYAYDELGNQTQQIDGLGRITYYEQDAFGRRIYRFLPGAANRNSTLPNTSMELTGYSKQGPSAPYTLRKSVRDFRNIVSTFDLDILDREATNNFPAVASVPARTALYTYTLFGQTDKVITGASGAMRTNFYTYDTMNRMARKDTPEGVLTYAYNEAGAVTNLNAYGRRLVSVNVTPSGTADLSVGYGYDALNRLTSVTNGTAITLYTRDAIGNLSTMVYPNTVTNLWQYDQRSRLTNLLWKSGGTTLGSFAYQLNETSQRTNLAESINGTVRSHQWAYNALQRLTNQTVSASPSGTLAYIYDLVGNRTNRTGTLGSLGTVTNGFNVKDWLAVDTYDNNGNTLTGVNGLGVATSSVYDGENHLVSLTSGGVANTLTYDADGIRATKVRGGVTTWWLWDDRNPTGYPQVVLEQNYIAGTSTNVSKAFTFGLRLISQKIGSTTNYYGSDGLGSVRMLINGSGGVTDTYTYDAYGSLIQSSGSTVNNYRYAGEEFDSDLALYNLRARWFNPLTGRFWSFDTFEGVTGHPSTLHKYLYCASDPTNRRDPSGHFSLVEINVSQFLQGFARAGAINVTANFAVSKMLGLRYVAKDVAWDFVAGGLMGGANAAVGNITRAISGKIGMRILAASIFKLGPPAATAAISTGEWVLKKKALDGEDVSAGEVIAVYSLTAVANYFFLRHEFLSHEKVEAARNMLKQLEQLKNGGAPRGFGSFTHYWSTLTPRARAAIQELATAVDSNADMSNLFIIVGNLFEGVIGEMMEAAGEEVGH